jgi:hypothetical protein
MIVPFKWGLGNRRELGALRLGPAWLTLSWGAGATTLARIRDALARSQETEKETTHRR